MTFKNSFQEALQFLTILRFKRETDTKALTFSAIYFPLIGAFLGLILIVINSCLRMIFPQALLSLIIVITLIILTRALHLDGLADTCDALFSGKNKEEMLAIMHDSHKGTFGVLGIITVILFKISLLTSIAQDFKNLGLFLMTVISRYNLNLAIAFFPYARQEGKAKVFFENKSYKIFWLSTLITLILLGFTMKWISIVVLGLTVIFTFTISAFIKRILGGSTGDTLGALCELSETVILFAIFVLTKFFF